MARTPLEDDEVKFGFLAPLHRQSFIHAGLFMSGILSAVMLVKAGETDDQFKLVLVAIFGLVLVATLRNTTLAAAAFTSLAIFNYFIALPVFGTVPLSDVVITVGAIVLGLKTQKSPVPAGYRRAFVLLCGATIVSAVLNTSSLSAWGSLRWIPLLILWIALVNVAERAEEVVAVWCVAGIVVALGGFAQASGQLLDVVGSPYLNDRVDSFFGYYTQFAGFMAAAALMGACLAAGAHLKRLRYLGGATALVCGVAIVTTLSRGGVLALAVGVLAIVVLKARNSRDFAKFASIAGVIAVMVFFLAPDASMSILKERVTGSGGINSGSDSVRFQLQSVGRRLVLEHPAGIGYGNFRQYATETSGLSFFHSHSTPIQIALDAGWVGAAAYAVVFYLPILWAIRIRRQLDWVSVGLVAVLAGMAAQGLYDYLFYETAWLQFHVAVSGLTIGRLFQVSSHLDSAGERFSTTPTLSFPVHETEKIGGPTAVRLGRPRRL
jgi:O-antigen ligase